MNLKTAAIRTLDYVEYYKLIENIDDLKQSTFNDSLFKTMRQLPPKESNLIYDLIQYRPHVFGRGYPRTEYMPTVTEYQIMREKVTGPFNFIWSDLLHLHKYLNKTYDIINISNIIDYMHQQNMTPVYRSIHNLMPHLELGGKIIAMTCDDSNQTTRSFIRNYPNNLRKISRLDIFSSSEIRQNLLNYSAIIIQRTK